MPGSNFATGIEHTASVRWLRRVTQLATLLPIERASQPAIRRQRSNPIFRGSLRLTSTRTVPAARANVGSRKSGNHRDDNRFSYTSSTRMHGIRYSTSRTTPSTIHTLYILWASGSVVRGWAIRLITPLSWWRRAPHLGESQGTAYQIRDDIKILTRPIRVAPRTPTPRAYESHPIFLSPVLHAVDKLKFPDMDHARPSAEMLIMRTCWKRRIWDSRENTLGSRLDGISISEGGVLRERRKGLEVRT